MSEPYLSLGVYKAIWREDAAFGEYDGSASPSIINWRSVPMPAQAVEACCCCGASGGQLHPIMSYGLMGQARRAAVGLAACEPCINRGVALAVVAFDARQRLLAEPMVVTIAHVAAVKTCATCTSPATVGDDCVYCSARLRMFTETGNACGMVQRGIMSGATARLTAALASEKPRGRRGKWNAELAKGAPKSWPNEGDE